MANPQDTGGFENWAGSRLPLAVAQPKSGTTGTMEYWLAARLPLNIFVATTAAAPAVLHLPAPVLFWGRF